MEDHRLGSWMFQIRASSIVQVYLFFVRKVQVNFTTFVWGNS